PLKSPRAGGGAWGINYPTAANGDGKGLPWGEGWAARIIRFWGRSSLYKSGGARARKCAAVESQIMADGGQQRGSSSSGTRRRSSSCWALRRDGADGGGGSGGGGGLSEESDSGEDNSVTRLWRRAFSGLKLAKDKATKKKKRSSMEDSEDRGTQKCAACCPQSEPLASR
uniref:Os04g0529700 protein n=1 Tax=Macrostomum lignano TaxID=282301 RepID=A0A1I8F5I8_9PLAT